LIGSSSSIEQELRYSAQYAWFNERQDNGRELWNPQQSAASQIISQAVLPRADATPATMHLVLMSLGGAGSTVCEG